MVNNGEHISDMTTMVTVTNTAIKRGYTENFKMTTKGLYAPTTKISYLPNEVVIDNFYRFEGQSSPEDNAILYLITSHDGIMGMLIDSYGADANEDISKFIKEVEDIQKTVSGHEQKPL